MTAFWAALAGGALFAVVILLFMDRQRRRDEAQAYLKGFRSVISGDPDAAIEALSDAARLGTPEAVDTYLALGALFRRTGDFSRAVRLHRNMLLGPALDPKRRGEVERELAEDYRRSGMLAEAAEIYGRLAPADAVAAEGLRDVRVEQGDLAAAVEVQRKLGPGSPDRVLAHLLAAQAREVVASDPRQAVAVAQEALRACPSSADALLALAEGEGASGNVEAALGAVGRALDADVHAAVLAWPSLCRAARSAAVEAFVRSRISACPDDASLHLLHARALLEARRNREALAAVRSALALDHSGEVTVAIRELLREAAAPGPEEIAERHELLVSTLLRRAEPLRCSRCRAEAASRSWRCRRCGAFDPYP